MNEFALFILLIFGVMGFGTNLFFRVIYLYCELQETTEINWRMQAFYTFGVPAAYMLVLVEVMWSTGMIIIP